MPKAPRTPCASFSISRKKKRSRRSACTSLCRNVSPDRSSATPINTTIHCACCVVEALTADRVRRIVLVRPAGEAGERLGFLPGDLTQKVDPYLRPMYDALYEMMGFERVAKMIERQT